MENLFVYGTLLNPVVQKKIIGRITGRKQDSLKKYEKSSVVIDGETYPVLVESSSDSQVQGVVLSVTKKELEKIDEYETKAYFRKEVELESGSKAWVYLKNEC